MTEESRTEFLDGDVSALIRRSMDEVHQAISEAVSVNVQYQVDSAVSWPVEFGPLRAIDDSVARAVEDEIKRMSEPSTDR